MLKTGSTPLKCSSQAFQKNFDFIWENLNWPKIQLLLPRGNNNNNEGEQQHLFGEYLGNKVRAKDRDWEVLAQNEGTYLRFQSLVSEITVNMCHLRQTCYFFKTSEPGVPLVSLVGPSSQTDMCPQEATASR